MDGKSCERDHAGGFILASSALMDAGLARPGFSFAAASTWNHKQVLQPILRDASLRNDPQDEI
jgi:hypothetical protein